MLFQKLVQQHRIDRVIADTVDLAFIVACDEVWIHLGYFFCDKAELWCRGFVALVIESNRSECQDRLTGLVHRLNCFLKAPRGTSCTELPVGIYHHWYGVIVRRCHATNTSDKRFRMFRTVADADRPRLTGYACVTNIDIVVAYREIYASAIAQCGVAATRRVVAERIHTVRRIVRSRGILEQCSITGGHVAGARSVVKERSSPKSRIPNAAGEALKRLITRSRAIARIDPRRGSSLRCHRKC